MIGRSYKNNEFDWSFVFCDCIMCGMDNHKLRQILYEYHDNVHICLAISKVCDCSTVYVFAEYTGCIPKLQS